MNYRVRHTTKYEYADPVSLSHHLAHLTPRSDGRQRCSARALTITPTPAFRRERVDVFGNRATYFSIEEPHRRLVVDSSCEVAVEGMERPPLEVPTSWETVRDRLRAERHADTLDAASYTFDSPHVKASPALAGYAAPSFPAGRPLVLAALDLTRRIHAEFAYDAKATNVSTPIATVLQARRGVCQDFAHLALGCLRALGLPARYVSGYLLTHPRPGQAKLVGADASHAWIAVHLPDYGWVDFDPTNGIVPRDEHITVAHGRDFGDVTPVRGVILGGGTHELTVAVDVTVA